MDVSRIPAMSVPATTTINQIGADRYEWIVAVDGWGDTSSVAATEQEALIAANDWLARFTEAQPLDEPVPVDVAEVQAAVDAQAAADAVADTEE